MPMHEDYEEFDNLQDDLADVNRRISEFWDQEDADDMEDTYGELLEEKDEIESRLAELRSFGAFW